MTTASPLQVQYAHGPSVDEVQQAGRAVFRAEELADGRVLIGVHGENDSMENTPNSSPGVLLPAPKPRQTSSRAFRESRASVPRR